MPQPAGHFLGRGARMRVADIKKLAAARRSAFKARLPFKATKPKRKPDSALDDEDDDEDDDDDDAFGIHSKRPRTVKDLPHARASPGASARKFASNARPTMTRPSAASTPTAVPEPRPPVQMRAARKFASNATAPGERGARKPRAKPTPTPKKPAPPTPKKPAPTSAKKPAPTSAKPAAKRPGKRQPGPSLPEAWTVFARRTPVIGPCPHGVEPRCRCKLCSCCPHGMWKFNCSQCRAAGYCEHDIPIIKCVRCSGGVACEHGKIRETCKKCVGHEMCPHGTTRARCRNRTCNPWPKPTCPHGRQGYFCRDCAAEGIGGKGLCEHGRERRRCKDCKGSGLCKHGKVITRRCMECIEEAHKLSMKTKSNKSRSSKSRSRR